MHKWGHCHQLMNKGCMWGTAWPPLGPSRALGLKKGTGTTAPLQSSCLHTCMAAPRLAASVSPLAQGWHWVSPILLAATSYPGAGVVPSAGRGWQGLSFVPGTLRTALVSYCSCCAACSPSHPAQYSTTATHHGTVLLHGTAMHRASVSPGLLFPLLISGHSG